MRIIGTIGHPALKITVFKTDERLSVKFEYGLMEQVFKFREGEHFRSMEDVRRLVDKPMLDTVVQNFNKMHRAREQAFSRLISPGEENEFDAII